MSQKVCVVAGVGPGIGKACCELYASKGYQVIMLARQQSFLDEMLQSLTNNARGITIDLTQEKAVNALFEDLHKQYGAIDILIYNAA